MKIENKNGLRLLLPESPEYFLYSFKTNQYHEKVYLGLNDSMDNYREIKKDTVMNKEDKKVKELEKIIQDQDAAISDLAKKLAALTDLINKK